MSLQIEELDAGAVTDDQLTRYHAFQSVILAERLPLDPVPPFGDAVRQLKSPFPNTSVTGFAAVEGDTWAGVALVVASDNDERSLRIDLGVLPDYRRRGVGSELLRRAAASALGSGRELITVDSHDTVPAGEGFAERVGATPGLRNHLNRLAVADVDPEMVQRWINEGPSRAAAYELVAFDSPIPDDRLEDVASIIMAMNDAPTDDLETAPMVISGDLVRAVEGAGLASGLSVWWLLAYEKSTGVVVGETDVRLDPKQPQTITQGTTVVRREHRGHALGKWLKGTMMKRILDERPDVVDIRTTNADSNAPMVGINTALGYKPYLGSTTWQLPVAALLH
jgi:GNAT superfamily N-acetyltransferase